MRGYVPDYELVVAKTLADAIARVESGYRPFAGGTDLMVVFESGKLKHTKYVSVLDVPELRGIQENATHVTFGGATTFSEVINAGHFSSLVQAAKLTGARAIQNRGTLAGNIANASPAADSPPALWVLDTEIELNARRWVPYATFHTGYKTTVMQPGEIITRIRIKKDPSLKHYYRKVGTRRAQAISKVCLCAAWNADEVRIALGSVGPTVVRAHLAEKALRTQGIKAAQAALAQDISPLDDIRSTRDYRLKVAQNLIEECLAGAV